MSDEIEVKVKTLGRGQNELQTSLPRDVCLLDGFYLFPEKRVRIVN